MQGKKETYVFDSRKYKKLSRFYFRFIFRKMSVVFGGSGGSREIKRGQDNGLDLFTVPPTNITYNGYRIVEINPTSESITPIEFGLPGSREYLDFSRSYFRMELTLKKADGGNLANTDARWLAPNTFHTIIKQPSVHVNGTLTTEQTDTYAYKAYHWTSMKMEKKTWKGITDSCWPTVQNIDRKLRSNQNTGEKIKVQTYSYGTMWLQVVRTAYS